MKSFPLKPVLAFNSPTTALAELVHRYNQSKIARYTIFYVRSSAAVDYIMRALCLQRFVYSATLINNSWRVISAAYPANLILLDNKVNAVLTAKQMRFHYMKNRNIIEYVSTTLGMLTTQEAFLRGIGGRLIMAVRII